MITTLCADRPKIANAVLDLFANIGRDHAIDPGELGPLDYEAMAALPRMWAAYERHWRGYCGSRLDPQFWHLEHPDRPTGAVRAADRAPIVVVGTGPSLHAALPELRRVRAGVHLFTSPRGADALADAGMVPDLVLVEHQTALDAHFSTRDLAHRGSGSLARVPLIAVEARTPPAFLHAVSPERIFIPDPLPTWGLWPATAVAMALMSGTRAVGLLGIDLGTRERPDPSQAPLRDALVLLAAHTDVACMDLGSMGAAKPHWFAATAGLIASHGPARPLMLDARPGRPLGDRLAHAASVYHHLAPFVAETRAALGAAVRMREGRRSADTRARMKAGLDRLMAAAASRSMRVDLQDTLGLSFLPRLWRTPPDPTIGPQLWRPVALAANEIVRQHESLGRRLERAA